MAYQFSDYGYVDSSGAKDDVASIAADTTHATAGHAIALNGQNELFVQAYATGHAAGSAGTIEFYLAFSLDGTNYSTAGTPIILTLNAASPVIAEPVVLDVRGVRALKVLKIINKDAAQQVDTLNVLFNAVQA